MPSWVSIFFIGRHHNSVHSKKQHLRAYRSIDDCNQLQVPQISHGFPYLLIPMFVLGLWCNARRDPILTSWAMRHFLFSDCCHPSLRLRNRLQTVFNLSVKDCTSNGIWHTTIPTIGDVIKESAVTAAVPRGWSTIISPNIVLHSLPPTPSFVPFCFYVTYISRSLCAILRYDPSSSL